MWVDTTFPSKAWVSWRPPQTRLHYGELYRSVWEYLRRPPRREFEARAREYLRILLLAATTLEAHVAAALTLLLDEGHAVTSEAVKALVSSETRPSVPAIAPMSVDLRDYDALLAAVGT